MPPPESEGTITWRLSTLEQAMREEREARRRGDDKLDEEKADVKDVVRMGDEFKSLRLTLQWFMGVMAAGAIATVVLIIQLAAH